jgi:phosphopantothenoylcysteine decarboxylase/phosphopantothenate--cysteine ligase
VASTAESRTADAPRRAQIILGVAGGIAAYKACEVLRGLTEAGHRVRVVPTASALRFVGAATWEALSGQPVATDVWDDAHEVPHVALGRAADLVVVVPATADLLARAAHGMADDLLTNTLLTTTSPVVFVPAMHTEMWQHPATVENVATLRRRGAIVVEPASGRLTGSDSGPGRLPEPPAILDVCRRVLACGALTQDLAGRTVVVTAGGTREPIDPVRFIGNRSSGRQGYAFATTAVARGARVVLVAADTALPDPAGVTLVRVGTAVEMRDAVLAHAAEADAVVMAAAVADFRPAAYSDVKIKRPKTFEGDGSAAPTIELVQNPHITRTLGTERLRDGQVVVGFAAETGDAEHSPIELGRPKLASYGVDLLVINEVGADRGFGSPENEAVVLGSDGSTTAVPLGAKEALADAVWDLVIDRFRRA